MCKEKEGDMAKKYSQDKSPRKGFTTACIVFGLSSLLYSSIFSLHTAWQYLLMFGLSGVAAYFGYVMGSGLDTSQQAPRRKPLPKTGDSTVDQMVEKGQAMVEQIRQENRLIDDPVLSKSMDEIEKTAERIFRVVVEQPKKAPQIRRFMNYYLPTTLKMLSAYRKMDEQQMSTPQANEMRQKIQNATDIVVGAFHKQLEQLRKDDMLDISTDIQVLETMLKQDDLTGKGIGNMAAQATAQQLKEE
jgi:hypothetical protein